MHRDRAAQIPSEILDPNTEVECIPVRNSPTFVTEYHEVMLIHIYIHRGDCQAWSLSLEGGFPDTRGDPGADGFARVVDICNLRPAGCRCRKLRGSGDRQTLLRQPDREISDHADRGFHRDYVGRSRYRSPVWN